MAEMNDFEGIQESFAYIAEALDSIRAQNAMNLGNMDKVLVNINSQLDEVAKDSSSDLLKVFAAELKRSLDERHDFVASKFGEIEKAFQNILQTTEKQLTGSEIKELFEIIASNLNTFSKDFSSQQKSMSEFNLKIEELQNDESQKKEILKNISALKQEVEKYGNGFESIILNLNTNFTDLAEVLKTLDTSDILANIKKDIENIFLSSNAILSTQQVIDHKNRELEATINTFITKDDFNVEREQVAKLIAQNLELTKYIHDLPTHDQFDELTEKIDTSIGVINALKNMLTETGKQNQKMLTAQLDSLEKKILNISTEEEFIGFRKELSEFARQVMDNTNLIRADLADTNSAVKNLYDFLNEVDIKNSFVNFTQISQASEENIKEAVSDFSKSVLSEVAKTRNVSKTDIENNISKVSTDIEKAKTDIQESSKGNLTTIVEHIQSIVNNIFSIKNDIKIENSENMDVIDDKLQEIKDEVVNTSNFVVQNAQDNLENVISTIEKISSEVSLVKDKFNNSSLENGQNIVAGFEEITRKIEDSRMDINNHSREGFAFIKNLVDDFSEKILTVKEDLEQDTFDNATELKETIGGLSLKLNTIQETMTKGYDVNFTEVKDLLEELTQITQSAKASLEQSSKYEILGIKANIEDLSKKLNEVEENIDTKSQANVTRIASLFVELTKDFGNYKELLNESTRKNFDAVSLCINNLNQQIEGTKDLFNGEMQSNFSQLEETLSNLPEIIKENQSIFENENKTLIEENSKNIQDVNEKVQSLIKNIIAKDSSFKEEVLFEFSGVKSTLEILKEDVLRANNEVDDNLTNQIAEFVENIEQAVGRYDEKTNSALISLQDSLTEYFDSVKQITLQSNAKLDNSIREASDIKSEIISLKGKIAEVQDDSAVSDLAQGLNQKFDELLVDLTQLEEKSSAQSGEYLQGLLGKIEEKFELTYSVLKELRNYSSAQTRDITEDIDEKADVIKTQLNLISTDIINILSSRTGEILSKLSSVNEAVDTVNNIGLEEFFVDIKSKLETGYFTMISVIKQDIEKINEGQLDKLAADFDNLNEKLDKILFRVASDNTKEIVELKTILTERVDNIASINSVLEVVLNRLEEINTTSHSNIESIYEVKNELVERLNVFEDSLIQAQDDSQSSFFNKIAEFQNRKTAAILEKIDESQSAANNELLSKISEIQTNENIPVLNKIEDAQNETMSSLHEINENVSEAVQKVNISTQEVFNDVKESIEDQIKTFENALLQTQYTTRTALLEKISEIQSNTKSDVSEVKENITATIDEFYSSSQEFFSDVKTELASKMSSLEELFLNSQEETRETLIEKVVEGQDRTRNELLYGVKENISGVTEELYESTQSVMSGMRTEIIVKINALEETLINSQDDSHTDFVEKLTQSQQEAKEVVLEKVEEILSGVAKIKDNNSTEFLYGFKESLIETIDEFSASTQELLSNTKIGISDSIELLKEAFLESQEEVQNAIIDKISDSQFDIKETILDKIIDSKNEILNEQDQIKSDILAEIKDGLSAATDDFTAIAKDSFADVKSDIIERIESAEEVVTQTGDDIKATILDKIVELNNDSETSIIDKMSESQTEFKEGLLSKINDTSSKTQANISEKLTETQENITENILSKIDSANEELKTEFSSKFDESQEDLKSTVADKISELNEELKTGLVDNILESQEDLKKVIVKEISKSQTKTEAVILDELEENIKLVKEVLETIASTGDEDSGSEPQDTGELDEIIKNAAASIESKIEETEENYKTSTQSLLSDVKMSFYEKVDDSLDGLKSFFEMLNEEKSDISPLLDEVKSEILDKFHEMTDSIEETINSVSVKTELDELNSEIKTSMDSLFEKIQEEFSSSLESSEKLNEVFDKSTSLEERVEKAKETILEDLSDKFAKFEIEVNNQKSELTAMSDDIKASLTELKENYIDLSLNSSMEISEVLVGFQEKIDNILSKLNEAGTSESTIDIKSSLENFDFNSAISQSKEELSEKIESVIQKIGSIPSGVTFEASENSGNYQEEFDVINQKLDALAMGSDEIPTGNGGVVQQELQAINQKLDTLAIGSDSETANNIKEIKRILSSQGNIADKLSESNDLDSLVDSSDIGDIKSELQGVLKNFETKLESLIQEAPAGGPVSADGANINKQLSSFKEELLENLVEFFNQISFAEESEDIKDFVDQKTQEIKSEIKSEMGSNLGIQNEIREIKKNLLSLQSSLEEEPDYSYTLQDVETDIAKLRLALKEISEIRGTGGAVNIGGLEQLSEDITSISTRTNKLLLNSDESYETLKTNLESLREVIYQFETKVKYIDNKEQMKKLDHKLESINKLALSSVQSDKIFNQTFMYLAEWIDKADSNIDSIKQNMVKTTDIEKLLDKFSKKFDRQEEKIKSLEAKIEKLTKAKPPKETDIKTLVQEVLSKVAMSELKPDAKLAKKVDGIDKQLATLGKNIEKITSYVD